MARPAITRITAVFSLSLAFFAHAGLLGGIAYWGQSHTQPADNAFESENIIYATYLEDAHALNTNDLLEESLAPPPVKWINATDNLGNAPDDIYHPPEPLPQDNFTIFTDKNEYAITQELIRNKEGIRLASIELELPFIEAQPNPQSPKNKAATTKTATGKNQGKGQVNRGKTQSARCSVAKASSKSKPKHAALVRIAVSASGSKKNIALAQSSGSSAFDNAALRSAKSAKCRPYIQNGTAKASTVQITYR